MARDKAGPVSPQERWTRNVDHLKQQFPQVSAWLFSEADFRGLLFKTRPDGTVLAVAKGYGTDGGPTVCFGVGYDMVLCLMALESTIAGNHWKEDKPWEGKA